MSVDGLPSTRCEYLADHYSDLKERFKQIHDNPEIRFQEWVQQQKANEDERMWAWYNQPEERLTQYDAYERARRVSYPEKYLLSQPSVSRALSGVDERILVEGANTVEQPTGLLTKDEYLSLDNNAPELLDAYRTSLARFVADMDALETIYANEDAPEWATDRFDELPAGDSSKPVNQY